MSVQNELANRAPHVDRAWVDDFVTELTLRGSDGRAIGAAVLEVESHMADRGGDVEEEFGAPREYAASLEIPDTQKFTRSEAAFAVAQSLFATLGVWLALTGIAGFFIGSAKIGMLTGVTLALSIVIITITLMRWRGPLLRAIVDRPIRATIVMAMLISAIGLLAALSTTLLPAFVVDTAPVIALGIGVALLLVWALLFFVARNRSGDRAALTFPVQ